MTEYLSNPVHSMIENAIYQPWITLDICFDLHILPVCDLLKKFNYIHIQHLRIYKMLTLLTESQFNLI